LLTGSFKTLINDNKPNQPTNQPETAKSKRKKIYFKKEKVDLTKFLGRKTLLKMIGAAH